MKYSQEALKLFNSKEVQNRFWSKVDKGSEEECWEWTACKNNYGYGMFTLNRTTHKSHILSLWSYLNKPPEGKLVCHTCDNPACVNPNHLWYGTQKDNMKDAFNKGRAIRVKTLTGEAHPGSKITEAQATEILRIRRDTKRGAENINKMFPGLGLGSIKRLIYNETWKHLPR